MTNSKKRVAVTISFSFAIRYLIRTGLVDKMKNFCEPVICIFWNEEDLVSELRSKGFEVHVLPETNRSAAYSDLRIKIDYWFKFFRLKSPTANVEPRYLEKFKSTKKVIIQRLREYYNYLLLLLPGAPAKLLKKEKAMLISDTNYNDMLQLVDELNIDAVFTVTPFHLQEDAFLRAADAKNKLMITSILSFDNIVKRGWVPVNYQCYMVWNKYNANEIRRIYTKAVELNNNNVHIVGAAQFDFYHQSKYILPRNEWLRIVGLPDTDRKIILYAGGALSLFPQETQFVQHIDEAITKGIIPGKPIILFRCHPVDRIERWKEMFKHSENIFFDSSWTGNTKMTYTNITDNDIAKLCSTLYYTDVHINLSSTMTVDGSVYGKPQIGPGYDEVYPNSKYPLIGYYYQEFYLPIMQTNGLAVARNRKELIDYVNEALQFPDHFTQKSKDIVEAIITYSDGKCTERVLKVLQEEIEKN